MGFADLIKTGERQALPRGKETFVLSAVDVVEGKVWDRKAGTWKENEVEQKLRFTFSRTTDGAKLFKNVRLTISARPPHPSAYYLLLRDLSDGQLAIGDLSDPVKVEAITMGFVGKHFVIKHEPTENGKYDTILSIEPDNTAEKILGALAPSEKAKTEKKTKQGSLLEPIGLIEDEIPF